MKKFRTAAALILALALALSLAGCGTAMSDASAMLVQGNLDEIYLGKFDPDFLTLVDLSLIHIYAALLVQLVKDKFSLHSRFTRR